MTKRSDTSARAPLLLVRHTAVDAGLKGFCYGASDVALSPEGEAQIADVAAEVTRHAPARVVHSGLTRAARLADAVAGSLALTCEVEPRLRELDFGRWELTSWDAIFKEVGHEMTRLVTEPDSYAPHGGETVADLANRAMGWFESLDRTVTTVAVCHGGPISAIRGRLAGRPPSEWPSLVPPYGAVIAID